MQKNQCRRSSRLAKKARLSASPTQIGDLADADLSAIFERLPPSDRLTISEVCRRWHELSRKAWLDVTELDLSPIPGNRIGPILRQCPNLRSVFALKKSFGLNELASLPQASKLSVVRFYDCRFALKGDPDASYEAPNDLLAKIFSESLRLAPLRELILHNCRCYDKSIPAGSYLYTIWGLSASLLPASLTRLQLSDLQYKSSIVGSTKDHLAGLGQLQSLECLILHEPVYLVRHGIVERICALKNLRELSIGPKPFSEEHYLGHLMAGLPKLEVLFLCNVDVTGDILEDLAEVITKNAVLRILVLSGRFDRLFPNAEPIELPARKRFPQGFGSDPLPLLHVFVGKEASQKIRFATSSSDAAIIHPITEPMPQFLERADIAAIFEGVAVAEKIKETVKFGGELWFYEQHDRAT